ncbi:hypothetical protein LINGRAHAP2_LOCUS2881, partial [Linum grandiflorum]
VFLSAPEICFVFLSLRRYSSKFFLFTCIHSSKRYFEWPLFTRKLLSVNLFLVEFQVPVRHLLSVNLFLVEFQVDIKGNA